MPALVVSLTIVAFGTSAPELLIAVNAVLNDASGIVLGNVVGSNIANVLLVLGVPALISTMNFQGCDVRRDYIVMLFATIAFIGLSYFGSLGLWQGAILLMILVCYLSYTVFSSAAPADNETLEGQDSSIPMWKIVGFLIVGLAGLPLGADLLVDNASIIARDFGVSEEVIVLTLIAVGTSLPESFRLLKSKQKWR